MFIVVLVLLVGILVLLYRYTHYTFRCGSSGFGVTCGAFSVNLSGTSSGTGWSFGAHYAFRGGASNVGASCGAFCVYLNGGAGYAGWNVGAAL